MMRGSAVVSCPGCGKLFAREPGKDCCMDCLLLRERNRTLVENALDQYDKRTTRDIAAFTGLPLHEVERIVKASAVLRHLVDTREHCTRCRKRLAEQGSDFCMGCRLDLYRAFGDAADELFTQLDTLEAQPITPTESSGLAMSVLSMLEQKRSRAGVARLHPAPEHRIR